MASFTDGMSALYKWLTELSPALVTTTGAFGPSKDRVIALSGVTTRQRMSWPPGTGPKAIIIAIKAGAITDLTKVCFDAESTTIADTNLAQVGDLNTTLQHKRIFSDTPYEERFFPFDTPLETIDFLPVTGVTEFKVMGV